MPARRGPHAGLHYRTTQTLTHGPRTDWICLIVPAVGRGRGPVRSGAKAHAAVSCAANDTRWDVAAGNSNSHAHNAVRRLHRSRRALTRDSVARLFQLRIAAGRVGLEALQRLEHDEFHSA